MPSGHHWGLWAGKGQNLCLFFDDLVADTWEIQAPKIPLEMGRGRGEMRTMYISGSRQTLLLV